MNKYLSSIRMLNMMLLTLLFSISFSAHADRATWKNAGGVVWVDSGGDCWMASISGEDLCGGPASAPADEDESGYFWPDDDDADGVVNSQDSCLFTPAGVAVDSDGCALDEDNDGIPDYLDACPGTPAGSTVDLKGCSILFTLDILFETNSARLTASDKQLIDEALPTIKASSSSMLEVTGHTDSRASSEYNQALSERRAASVKDYLVSSGIAASRIETHGWGESRPVASNETDNGRAKNRRVEIRAK